MLELVLLGAGFAFAAAIQPGPLQAFLLSRVLRNGWQRTLPAALSPIVSDGPIAALMLFVLRTMPMAVQRGLRLAGGTYLLWLAWAALREARLDARGGDPLPPAPRTFLKAVWVNLLNPNPYLGWAFVLGPATLAAWAQAPALAIALIAPFYATMTLSLAGFIALCGTTRLLSRRVQQVLMLIAAATLAALGVWQFALAF